MSAGLILFIFVVLVLAAAWWLAAGMTLDYAPTYYSDEMEACDAAAMAVVMCAVVACVA